MSMLKQYFNFTYTESDFTSEELSIITAAFETDIIQTVLPKITKIKLDEQYTFIHKYCNNCYIANNQIYQMVNDIVIPEKTGVTE